MDRNLPDGRITPAGRTRVRNPRGCSGRAREWSGMRQGPKQQEKEQLTRDTLERLVKAGL